MALANLSRQQLSPILENDRAQHGALRERQSLPHRFEHRLLFREQPQQRRVQIVEGCAPARPSSRTSSQVSCASRCTSYGRLPASSTIGRAEPGLRLESRAA